MTRHLIRSTVLAAVVLGPFPVLAAQSAAPGPSSTAWPSWSGEMYNVNQMPAPPKDVRVWRLTGSIVSYEPEPKASAAYVTVRDAKGTQQRLQLALPLLVDGRFPLCPDSAFTLSPKGVRVCEKLPPAILGRTVNFAVWKSAVNGTLVVESIAE